MGSVGCFGQKENIKRQSLIKDFVTAMSAIRKRIFTSLKNEHTENYEINQLLAYEQPSAYIVANDEYSADTTLTPVLTANKGFVLGYTDEDFGIYQKGECIIFDDFTMDAKYVSFPFKVKSSAIKILTAKPNVNLRFMFEYLSYLELKSEEHKRHYISEIASLIIELPSKEKQNRIAYLMTSLDNKLALEENTMARYMDEKQYILLQMFIWTYAKVNVVSVYLSWSCTSLHILSSFEEWKAMLLAVVVYQMWVQLYEL